MSRDTINAAGSEAVYNNFHFSQAVRSGNTVICSGQIGTNPDGRGVPDDIKEEFRNAWRGVGNVLEAAGLGYENIIEYTTFHVGLQSHIADFMAVKDEFVSEPWPAWTAIGITELAVPGAHVEIRVIAQTD
jgi:enamine deaminase RidA (YjgF/YER057c/UK114 family)